MNLSRFAVNGSDARLHRFTRLLSVIVALCVIALMPRAHALPVPVATVRTVALSGQPAPGTPDGVTFREFNQFYFSLNDAGQVAFLGYLTGPDLGAFHDGLWSEGSGNLSLVARRGSPAPGTPDGGFFGSLQFNTVASPVLNDAGQIAFSGSYTEGDFLTSGRGIWSQRFGALALVARDGTQAPGTPSDVNFAGFGGQVFNDSGQSAFLGELTGDGVDGSNEAGIWSEGSGSLALVAREGSQAVGMPAGVKHDVFFSPVLNDAGQIAFASYWVEEGASPSFGLAVWSEGSGNLALVTTSGNHAPGTPSGTNFTGFSAPVINNAGQTAFWAYLDGSDDPSDPNDDGIWSEGSGSLALVARRGSPAPGTPAGVNFGNEQLTTFDSPVLNDAGQTAFRGFIFGPGVDATNNEGIWAGEAGELSLVARAGSHAPGTPAGVTFQSFFPWNGALQMNALGQTVFTAFLRDGDFGAGIGIWATDVAGTLRKIASTGDLLEIAPGDVRAIIDLSFIDDGSGGSDGRAIGINNRGQVAFWAKFAGGDEGIFVSNLVAVPEPASVALVALSAVFARRRRRRTTKVLCAIAVLSLTTTANAARYTVTDLGALGGTDSRPWAINDDGQVAGYAATTDDLSIEGFLWTPTTPNSPSGSMLGLESLNGTGSWATAINSGGQVAGVSFEGEVEGDDEHATLWNPTTPNGTTGTLHDLGTLGGTYSEAHGINDLGQVSGAADITGDAATHAFMWKPTTPGGSSGTMYDLGSLGGSFTIGWDVNASGAVTGGSDIPGDAGGHAFLWKPTTSNGTSGVMHDLGTLGGTDGAGSGLNDSGQVTGWSQTTDDAAYRAFLWTPTTPGGVVGEMLDLGTLDGSDSYGYAVNSHGHVVGLSYVPPEVSNNSHAFLYTAGGGMVDLNTLIDPLSGWELLDADGVNDAGQITGQGLIGEEYHAFLLTPVPTLPGDFNLDGFVDGADLELWKTGFGVTGNATLLQGDADGDRDVDGADFLTWQRQLNSPSPADSANATIPEPATLLLCIIAAAPIRHMGGRMRQELVNE